MLRLTEIVIGIFSAILCLLFFLTIAFTYYDKENDKVPKALQQLLILNMILQLSDMFMWLTKGMEGTCGLLIGHIMNYVYFVGIALIGISFCYYYDCVIEWFGEKKISIIFDIVKVTAALLIICVTINLFTGWFYRFDERNVYYRCPGFVVILLLQFIMLFTVIGEIALYLKTSLKKIARFHLAAFGIILIAGIYQSMFYGLSLINVAFSFVMIVFYAVHMKEVGDMQKEQDDKLREQERILKEQQEELERQSKQLEDTKEKLVAAKMQLLNAQIKPHFIYNTIALIRNYCYSEPETAADALGKFAKFLRGSIRSISATECIPLGEELSIIDSYIYLQLKRFEERLIYLQNIETDDCFVPALSIQIMVENAVLHGIENSENGGIVEVHTFKENGSTVITVKDNGAGFDTSKKIDEKQHVGIANVRERLEKMCNGTLELESEIGKGTLVKIIIPDKEEKDK